MPYLIITTLLWSFSFSIIGYSISSDINSWTLAFLRSFIAFIFFAPWINFKAPLNYILKNIFIGVLQIGIMYLLYLSAFSYTSVQKILLFTITTPFYVALISQIIDKKIKSTAFIIIILSILGALIIRITVFNANDFTGLILIQLANICFALGQVLYKKLKAGNKNSINIYTDFAFFFMGASFITFIGLIISPYNYSHPESIKQWIIIIWLGGGATGLGYYFWNYGSTQVKVETLAVMNNLVIPLGLFIEIAFFSGNFNMQTLLIGSVIILASIVASLKYSSN